MRICMDIDLQYINPRREKSLKLISSMLFFPKKRKREKKNKVKNLIKELSISLHFRTKQENSSLSPQQLPMPNHF